MSRLATELTRMIDQAEKDEGRTWHAVTMDTGMLRDLIRQDQEDPEDGSWLAAALRHACAVAALDQPLSHGIGITQPLAVTTVRALLDRHDAHHQSTTARIRYEVTADLIRHLRREASQLRGIGLRVRAHELDHQADLLTGRADAQDPDARRRAADEDIADLLEAANARHTCHDPAGAVVPCLHP